MPNPPSVTCRGAEFRWGSRTYIMGIINATTDSFSGDGLAGNAAVAVEQAVRFVADGADVLDIGAESTRPGHRPISAGEELQRLLPILEAVRQAVEVPISVDTSKAAVAREAVRRGADIINDIWGFQADPEMAPVAAASGVPVVLMHNRANAEYRNLMAEIITGLRQSIDLALAAGIPPGRIIVDPGIGFGKTKEQNLDVLAHLEELKSLGFPLLLGTSRKSVIGYVLDLPVTERLEGTAATVALGIAHGADIVRVHDVRQMVRVARMADAIVRRAAGGPR